MATLIATILAGGEFGSPADAPSSRLDAGDQFPFVGALKIGDGHLAFRGSAVAISPDWIVTAGHNADFDDDGVADASWSGYFHFPGSGVFGISEVVIHPAFSGFAKPSVHDDLALMRLASPLPLGSSYPSLGSTGVGDSVALVGFGRSGYGSYGYTTAASLTDRRFGSNVIDNLALDDEGTGTAEVFRYDFDDPSTVGLAGGSLGNDLETIIGPGDSGGAALKWTDEGWQLVGINTFTEGFGGRFGDEGGGILIEPYADWIHEVTGIPEPTTSLFFAITLVLAALCRSRSFAS